MYLHVHTYKYIHNVYVCVPESLALPASRLEKFLEESYMYMQQMKY